MGNTPPLGQNMKEKLSSVSNPDPLTQGPEVLSLMTGMWVPWLCEHSSCRLVFRKRAWNPCHPGPSHMCFVKEEVCVLMTKSPLFLCNLPWCQKNDGLSCDAKLTENKKQCDDQTRWYCVHAPQTFPNKPSVTSWGWSVTVSQSVEFYVKWWGSSLWFLE